MAWPPAVNGTETGLLIEGKTTLRWGTNALLQLKDADGDFLVVLRFNQAPKQEVNYLTNGNGIQTTRIRLTHGAQWDITVRDDTSVTTNMRAADKIAILDAGGLIGSVGLSYSAEIIDPGYDTSPGQPGERTLRVEALTLIEGLAGTAQI